MNPNKRLLSPANLYYRIGHLSSLFFLFILLFATALQTTAQQPDSLWTKVYGGADYDRGNSMIQTDDGSLVIIGEYGGISEFGTRKKGDLWLVKTDPTGDTLWTKKFKAGDFDIGNAIKQTSDGGFIIAGNKAGGRFGTYDAWLIRTDAFGDTLWTRTYGTDSEESANDVIETADGGFVFTGFASSPVITRDQDAWLVKTDSAGDTLWTGRYYSGDVENVGNRVLETVDGDFVVAGITQMRGQNEDAFLFKTDENGDELWTKTYNKKYSARDGVDYGRDIIELENDGFMVLGFSDAYNWLLRTDVSGDTVYTKHFYNDGKSFKQTSDGGFIITGNWLVRTDTAGDTLWTIKNLSGISNSVVQTSDGGFVVSGYNMNYDNDRLEDLWIFKVGPEGNYTTPGTPQLTSPANHALDVALPVGLQWETAPNADTYGIQVASDEMFTTIVAEAEAISDTEFSVDDLNPGSTYFWRVRSYGNGETSDWSDVWDFEVIMATSTQPGDEIPTETALWQNYPNPFNPVTNISYDLPNVADVRLEVFDMIGRQVALLVDNQVQPGRHQVSFDASNLSSGIYIYRLQVRSLEQEGQIFTRKLTVIK